MSDAAAMTLPTTWDSKALFAKAQRYIEEMQAQPNDDWTFVLWASLALEILARAALARVSPVLLADPDNRNNIYFARGHTPTMPKFVPKSIGITEVFNRLSAILPNFDKE